MADPDLAEWFGGGRWRSRRALVIFQWGIISFVGHRIISLYDILTPVMFPGQSGPITHFSIFDQEAFQP